MKILSSEYVTSSAKLSQCPKPEMPEFAFIGRSNVGKSSLINMICNKQNLSKTSSKPGKTVTINHFLINKSFYFVDLPGYGYAARSMKMREEWEKNLWEYIKKRESLKYLFVLIDSRIPPQKIDIEFINKSGEAGMPIVIVFTKTDKDKASKIKKNIDEFCAELLKHWEELPTIIETSSLTKAGKPELLRFISDNMN